MVADRCVDTAMAVEIGLVQHLLVQFATHAVQALVLEVLAITRHSPDRADGVRVMGRKLRIERLTQFQQARRAGEIGNVGVGLAREHRVAGVPFDLGQLDLAIPVGTLDQPNRNPVPGPARQRCQPLDRRPTTPQIGLQRQAQAVPAGQRWITDDRGEHVELQHQARRFLSVDGQGNSSALRLLRQLQHDRHQFGHHTPALGLLVARMQCRQLDRDARRIEDFTATGSTPDSRDRRRVGLPVTLRIGGRQRGLAEHIERVAIASVGLLLRALHRRGDRAAHYILMAHDPHRLTNGQAHYRLTGLVGDPGQHRAKIRAGRLPDANHASGQHQPPGRRVDEQRLASAEVRFPVSAGEFVGNQRLGGLIVRNPQQRLGQAHQHNALFRGQVIFAHERFHRTVVLGTKANPFDQVDRRLEHRGPLH